MFYLSEYQTFDNVHELNFHVKQHTNCKYHEMNETQRNVLQIISQYSVKYKGASHIRIQMLADVINKSRRTIERAIRVLIELGVIDRINTTRRVSGGKGANIYVIKPFVDDAAIINDVSDMSHCEDGENLTTVKDTTPIVKKESANLLSYKSSAFNNVLEPSINNVVDNFEQPMDQLETSHRRPYSRFKDSVIQFIGQGDKGLIYRLYGVYLSQTKALRKAYEDDFLIDIAIRGIQATFHATKRKEVRNIPGYFNGAFSNMLDDLYTQTVIAFWGDPSGGEDNSLYDIAY